MREREREIEWSHSQISSLIIIHKGGSEFINDSGSDVRAANVLPSYVMKVKNEHQELKMI